MVDHQPTPPHLVEVVSAEDAESLVADVVAELAMLEEELGRLGAEAAGLERRVALSRRESQDGAMAVPLVRQVLETQTAATRAAMAVALDAAIAEAEALVARARVAAEAPARARPSRWAPEPGTATPDPLPADEADHHVEPEQPGPIALVPPPHEDEPEAQADAITTVMPVIAADDRDTGELAWDASAFGEFWVDGRAEAPARNGGTGVIDLVLPLVALLIIAIVMLSWIG